MREERKINIWIFNHYATNQFFEGGGRHQWFCKYLNEEGYNTEIFCACTGHVNHKDIDMKGNKSIKLIGNDGVRYCAINTSAYQGNGFSRVRNMFLFSKNLFEICRKRIKAGDKPDIIIASSVHPLTLLVGIELGKKIGVPCICEIRDLWPFTLVEFGKLKRNGLLTKLLYQGERYIYRKADAIIFTIPDCKKYILDKQWENDVDINKVFYINNGIDLDNYEYKIAHTHLYDKDLENDTFKVMYTGSMGQANQIDAIIEAAEKLSKDYKDIIFLLYGEGVLKNLLEQECKKKGINNIVFKGNVDKKLIPYILNKGDISIFTMMELKLYRYGISPNKLFDYLAAGKPIVTNSNAVKSITGNADCIVIKEKLAEAILAVYYMETEQYDRLCNESLFIAKEYSYEHLTKKLITVIESVQQVEG